jgi:predicted  nucleic acid-binding Zn-ribbon protein
MPHQCVRCSTMYDDGARELLEGCKCGAKVFFFIKKSKLEAAKKEADAIQLTSEDKKQIEEDIYDLVGTEIDRNTPVVLDLEAIKVLKPGKYELDIVNLFKNKPVIFKLEDGKYMIDLKKSFSKDD